MSKPKEIHIGTITPETVITSPERPPYPVWWPEVPVNFSECETFDQKLKHRIRRAVEKSHDFGYLGEFSFKEVCELIYQKIFTLDDLEPLFNIPGSQGTYPGTLYVQPPLGSDLKPVKDQLFEGSSALDDFEDGDEVGIYRLCSVQVVKTEVVRSLRSPAPPATSARRAEDDE